MKVVEEEIWVRDALWKRIKEFKCFCGREKTMGLCGQKSVVQNILEGSRILGVQKKRREGEDHEVISRSL